MHTHRCKRRRRASELTCTVGTQIKDCARSADTHLTYKINLVMVLSNHGASFPITLSRVPTKGLLSALLCGHDCCGHCRFQSWPFLATISLRPQCLLSNALFQPLSVYFFFPRILPSLPSLSGKLNQADNLFSLFLCWCFLLSSQTLHFTSFLPLLLLSFLIPSVFSYPSENMCRVNHVPMFAQVPETKLKIFGTWFNEKSLW